MIRLLRSLLALPFRLPGGLLLSLGMPIGFRLLRAAWWIGGDGGVAAILVNHILKTAGPDAALSAAENWMASRPRVEIAALAGLLCLQTERRDEARSHLDSGRQLGSDPDGSLDLLELLLAMHGDDDALAAELLARFEARNDLSATVRKLVINERMWQTLLTKDFGRAAQYADRLLAVADDPQASLAMWAIDQQAGRTDRARQHLAGAAAMDPVQRLHRQYLCCVAIGLTEEAQNILAEMSEHQPELVAHAQKRADSRGPTP